MRRVPLLFSFLFLALAAFGQTPSATAPLTLDQAVQEAIDSNLSLIAERYNVSMADARIMQARLRPNPVFTYGQDYQDLFGMGFNAINGAGPPEWNTRLDYIVEGAGKRSRRIEVAEGARAVAEFNLLNTIRQLTVDVQNSFVDVLAAKESVDLAQRNLASLNEIVGINQTRVRAGDLAKVELVRSRLAALTFQNAVDQARLRLRTARTRLETLLGRKQLTDDFDVAGSLRGERIPLSFEKLYTTALEARPDLAALRRDQARSQADIRLQLAQGKIDYTLSAQYHHQYGYVSRGNAMGFFLSVPLPLYNRNQGEIERARRESRQIETRLRAAQFSIAGDVRIAFDQYATARTLLDNIEKNMLDDARSVRETMAYSYRRGEASLIEFLDAQRAFNDTMQSYNDARADYARSLYLIESTIGKPVTP
jgi:outer membrane protein, heavy metal efflux system